MMVRITSPGLIFDSFGCGLQMMTVPPGSLGAEAGLQAGDVIATVDGKIPSDAGKQPAFLEAPGTVLHLSVHRGSASRAISITLRDIL